MAKKNEITVKDVTIKIGLFHLLYTCFGIDFAIR